MLTACLWYFVYFVPPSPPQMEKFDKLVHGMLWGRKAGSPDGTARVSMARLSTPNEYGGKNILQPSVMVEAIQANMVCRAIHCQWRGFLQKAPQIVISIIHNVSLAPRVFLMVENISAIDYNLILEDKTVALTGYCWD